MKDPVDYFDSESLRKDLKGKTVRAGVASSAAQAASIVVGLVAISVLARLLDPADFGLVAMVAVFTNFAVMFVDAGFSTATIQHPNITRQQASNLFWIAALVGVLVAAVVAAASPAIAWFYGRSELTLITLALTASYVMAGVTVQHQALLQRAMRLEQLALIRVTASVVGVAVAIVWAWRRHGQEDAHWALVAMPLATSFVRMTGTWLACRWRPGPPRRGAGTRSMVEFGANLTGFRFINYFARNLDTMLLAQFFPAEVVGGYDRVYRLFLFPLQSINGVVAQVVLPPLSRVQHDAHAYRNAHKKMLTTTLMASMPLAAFTAANSESIVEVLLGSRWLDYAPVLMWLALAGVGQSLTNTAGWLYNSQGRGRDLLMMGFVGGGITILAIALSAPWGVITLAKTYALVSACVVTPGSVWWACRRGPVTVAAMCRAAQFPAMTSAAVAVASLLGRAYDAESAYAGLATCSLLAGIVWAVAVWLTRRHTGVSALGAAFRVS